MVSPESGEPVGIHDSEDPGVLVFPPDDGLVPGVGEQLVHVVPQQPAVCNGAQGAGGSPGAVRTGMRKTLWAQEAGAQREAGWRRRRRRY